MSEREPLVRCIGCGKGIGNKPYHIDENGENGCPACFTDDGSGMCWHRSTLDPTPPPES